MQKFMKTLLVAAIGAMATAAVAQSEPPAAQSIPKALQMAARGGVKVQKSFPAVAGLTGWVLNQPDGQTAIVYSTADGKYVLAGALVDETGKNLTASYQEAQVPRPDFSSLEKSSYVVEGAKSPKAVVYAFMDPNCIFCHLEWKALQAYEKVGLQVRWVQVAFLKPDSAGKAAALLEAKEPAALLTELHTKYDAAHESGGIAPLPNVSAGTMAKIRANNELMHSFGFNGTPALVYKDATGKVQYHPGMVRLSELPAMLGLPAQANNDPELARFK